MGQILTPPDRACEGRIGVGDRVGLGWDPSAARSTATHIEICGHTTTPPPRDGVTARRAVVALRDDEVAEGWGRTCHARRQRARDGMTNHDGSPSPIGRNRARREEM